MRTLLFLLTLIILAGRADAQDLKVIDFYKEISTINIGIQKKDLNGRLCALVKVQLPIAGVKFEGNVIDSRYDINEYLLYMSPNSKKLTIKCPQKKPLHIDFSDVSQIKELESKGVYVLTLEMYSGISFSDDSEYLSFEYKEIVEKSNECFLNKDFVKARLYYEDAINPKFVKLYDIDSFRWIGLCDSIIKAQSEYRAITPELAASFKGLSGLAWSPEGFSDGVMVIDYVYGGYVTLIHCNGEKTHLSDAYVEYPGIFVNKLLPINLNGAPCFINTDGTIVLNYRKSDYNELFKDSYLEFKPFINGYSVIFDPRKDGKYGIINKYGNTILPLTKKYEGIKILDWEIILYDKKNIYKWILPSQNAPILDRKLIFKLTDYDGWIRGINNDYILSCSSFASSLSGI